MPNDFSNRVRVELYRLFVELGKCPTKAEMASALNCSIDDITASLTDLSAEHMLVLQPSSGEVLMASPLSTVPTSFAVETDHSSGVRNWHANCIWDALGVIAMLHTEGRVLTSCGCCGDGMVLTVSRDEVSCEPTGLVHFAIPARHWWDDIVFN